jgi:hypothetical protein
MPSDTVRDPALVTSTGVGQPGFRLGKITFSRCAHFVAAGHHDDDRAQRPVDVAPGVRQKITYTDRANVAGAPTLAAACPGCYSGLRNSQSIASKIAMRILAGLVRSTSASVSQGKPVILLSFKAWCRHGEASLRVRPVPARVPSMSQGRYWISRSPRRTVAIRCSGLANAVLAKSRRISDQMPSVCMSQCRDSWTGACDLADYQQ